MVPGRPLREEITTIPNHDSTQHTIMQQMLRKKNKLEEAEQRNWKIQLQRQRHKPQGEI